MGFTNSSPFLFIGSRSEQRVEDVQQLLEQPKKMLLSKETRFASKRDEVNRRVDTQRLEQARAYSKLANKIKKTRDSTQKEIIQKKEDLAYARIRKVDKINHPRKKPLVIRLQIWQREIPGRKLIANEPMKRSLSPRRKN